MASSALVVAGIAEGARFVGALEEAGIAIDAAFWLLTSEYSDWRLMVATPIYDQLGSSEASRQILGVLRSLDDVDYLMDKVTIVGLDDRRVRALRQVLRTGLPKHDYYLGWFYARDLDALDSYVYRLLPREDEPANGTASKNQDGATSKRTARAASGA